MIKNWRNARTRMVYETGAARGFRGLDAALAGDRLDMLQAAGSLADISPLRSVNLHALKGSRKGQWAINVNGPWRICFRSEPGGFADVEIVDYH